MADEQEEKKLWKQRKGIVCGATKTDESVGEINVI
jgi:hypothetical protein